jgi:DNA relaxase NicK
MNASTELQERAGHLRDDASSPSVSVDAPLSGPPMGSTGVYIPDGPAGSVDRLGIGWAQGTTRTTGYADVLDWLRELFGPATERGGTRWYHRSWSFETEGVKVADGPRSGSSNAAEVYIEVTQGACDGLGWDGCMRLLALLSTLGVRLSRCDVYYDDRRRIVDPSTVMDAVQAGQTRSHLRYWRRVDDSAGGFTAYLGKRASDCMLRVYRKWAESGDAVDGVRWEMEAKGERAGIVADFVRRSPTPAVAYFELVRAFVDFVDTTDGARPDRAPLLDWWAELVQSAGRAKLVLGVVVDSLARKVAWIRRAVTPTLALLFHAYGSEGMSTLIAEGWPRARWDLLPVAS